MKKFSISNIAWRAEEDEPIAAFLSKLGVQGIEVAPTRLWRDPLTANAKDVTVQRHFWELRGIQIVAMQSLLFGHPELTIFETPEVRSKTMAYLLRMISFARDLGAGVLVFGSPKNRKIGDRTPAEVQPIAVDFFRELGNQAARAGVCFCIEPNPSYYECDFITTSSTGLALVQAVNSAGFGLHLDAAAMTLSNENAEPAIAAAAQAIRHFHVSEKDLAPIGSKSVDHARFSAALHQLAYKNWISAEMRPTSGDNVPSVKKALEMMVDVYGR